MAKRIRIHAAGGWDKLEIEDYTCPEPRADEVKLSVKAAGVNFADTAVRQGLYSSAKKFVGWPITPGFEVSGTISKVGSSVTDYKAGDRVMAITRFGGYSSEVCVSASYIRKIPKGLSYEQAASIPAVFGTSYFALYWLARVHRGSTALVHSAGGGVGLALIQMLKNFDCAVTGVVGDQAKSQIVMQYGADTVIDKSSTNLWSAAEHASPKGFDLIFDPNGLSTIKQSYNHLAKPGLLFIYGHQSMLTKGKGKQNPASLAAGYLRTIRFNPFKMISENRSVIAFNVSYLFDDTALIAEFYDYLLSKLRGGEIRPLPVSTYDYTDVVKAHQAIESGKTTGKLVLKF